MQQIRAKSFGKPIPIRPPGPSRAPGSVPQGKSGPVPRPAGPARHRRRHSALLVSFLLMVLLPTLISGSYLWFRAVDQYTSTVAFAVRTQKSSAVIDMLGGLSQLTGASSTDASMVAAYLQSQDLVAKLDAPLNLRAMFSRPARADPIFAFDPSGSIEDLVDYWNRMVTVAFDPGTGLIEMDVQAFTPQEAQRVAQAAFAESSQMINELSAIAQQDATKSARQELAGAEDRLRAARVAIEAFRNRTQILDPSADVSGQMGLLNSLQDQLVAAMIDLDLLQQTTRSGDPRLREAQRKIEVIRARISDERKSFGTRPGGGADPSANAPYAALLGEYERLTVDQDFAEKTYVSAMAGLDAAQAEARQQSLYLAAYVKPTLAQASVHPRRALLTGLVGLFLFLGWAVLALIWYSLRDRR